MGALLFPVLCRQYHYVLQSLMLWREVSNDMFKLWYLAETDMLRQGASYRLCDTGQGLNRVQVRVLRVCLFGGGGGGCKVALQTVSQEWQELGWGQGLGNEKRPTL